jgi:hypothetical protein
MVASTKGLGPEKDSGKVQQHIQDRPIFSSEMAPHRNVTITVKIINLQMGLHTKTY